MWPVAWAMAKRSRATSTAWPGGTSSRCRWSSSADPLSRRKLDQPKKEARGRSALREESSTTLAAKDEAGHRSRRQGRERNLNSAHAAFTLHVEGLGPRSRLPTPRQHSGGAGSEPCLSGVGAPGQRDSRHALRPRASFFG